MKKTVKAFAKINLFLDMVSRRKDGYHDIISLMKTVSLHDTVTVSYEPSEATDISVSCNSRSIPCDESNLAYKAAVAYPFAKGKIEILIEKNIPISAGLAGGSADAAATLVALNQLCACSLSMQELKEIGASLGADVPFCIECGTCLTEGIGERMTEFAPMPFAPIVIAKMGEGMSTPKAYGMLDARYDNFLGYIPKTSMLDKLKAPDASLDEYCKGIYNIFEEVVEPERPFVTQIKQTMLSHGAVKATMSGSGTSVFGIFRDEAAARAAASALIEGGADVHVCYPSTAAER